jgi:hypothetical protein
MPGLGGLRATAAASDELEDTIDQVRRKLKLPLHCVLLGLRGEQRRLPGGQQQAAAGVGQLATEETQNGTPGIVSALNAVVTATDQFEDGLEEMMKAVLDRTRDLEKLLPKAADHRAGGRRRR